MRIILNIKLKTIHADPIVTPRLDFSSHDTVAEHNYGLQLYAQLLEAFQQDAVRVYDGKKKHNKPNDENH